ncbi:MAG: hypothetical protein ACREJU_15650 [Nitrospiraceae bacterium]
MDALSRLAGGMAHDFNHLLTVIYGFSEQVLNQLDHHDPHRIHLNQIQDAVERAAVLTRNLVAFSHHQVLQPTIQDLNVAITEMETLLRRLIGEQIELSIALSAEAGQIVADWQQLKQIVVNLVNHARDVMPHGGRIMIATTTRAVGAAALQHTVRQRNDFAGGGR